MKKISLLFLFVIGYSTLCGQETILNFHQLTSDEGLTESTNYFLHTDHLNLTWIANLNGLDRFDGKIVEPLSIDTTENLKLRELDIQSPFFETPEKDIWFTTAQTVICYRIKSGEFISINPEGTCGPTGDSPYAFHLEQGRFLWVRSNSSLYRIDTQDPFVDYRESIVDNFTPIRAAAEVDANGRVHRVYGGFWREPSVDMITFAKSGPYDLVARDVIFERTDNTLYDTVKVSQIITNIGKEVCFLTEKGLLFFNADDPEYAEEDFFHYPDGILRRPFMTHAGDYLLLSSNSDKIFRFRLDLNNRGFDSLFIHAFNLDTRRRISNILNIFLQRDSILWIGVRGEGLYYTNLKNQGLPSIFEKNGLPPAAIRHIHQQLDGDIIAVSDDGRTWGFDRNGTFKIYEEPFPKGTYPPNFKQLQLENGEIWAISDLGLGKFSPESNRFAWLATSKTQEDIYDVAVYQDRYLIMGTQNDLQVYDTKLAQFTFYPKARAITKIFVDRCDRIWLLNNSYELIIWKALTPPSEVNIIGQIDNIGIVNQLAEDNLRNRILVATSIGLIAITEGLKKDTELWQVDSRLKQYIQSVQVDDNNNIWLGTNRGILRYSPNDRKQGFRSFTIRDGLSSNEYSPGASFVDENGKIWFAGTRGIDVLNTTSSLIGKAPTLSIKYLKVYGEEKKFNPVINLREELQLEHDENTLTFGLAAPEYTDPQRNKFKVYLHHENKVDSSIIDNGNTHTYPYLPHGDYLFQFRACNAEGIWQNEVKELSFTINPPWYKTTMAISAAVMLGLAFAAGVPTFLYRIRLRLKQMEIDKKESLQKQTDQINAEFHSLLNDGLITIKNNCIQTKRLPKSEKLAGHLEVIHKKTLDLFNKKKHLIWLIDPRNELLDELIVYIRFYAATLLKENKLTGHLNIPAKMAEVKIGTKAKFNLFMTAKELLHNILKSAGCSSVSLDIHYDNHKLYMTVSDDGVGFDLEEKLKNKDRSYGLRKCQEWMNELGGEINWQSIIASGTKVHIEIPITGLL